MTIVVSPQFTVQIVSGSNPYAGYALGEFHRIYTGDPAKVPQGIEPAAGVTAYSGFAYDSASGTIYLHGGGHNDANDNRVWRLSVITPTTWVNDGGYAPTHGGYPTPPDTLAALQADVNLATYPGAWQGANPPTTLKPISRHTRYSMTWVSSLGKLTVGGGSLWGGIGLGDIGYPGDAYDTWLYTPGGTWEYKGSTTLNANYLDLSAAMFHSGRNRVFTAGGFVNNRHSVAEWNPSSTAFDAASWTPHWDGVDGLVLTPAPYDCAYPAMWALDVAGDRIFALVKSASVGLRTLVYTLTTRRWAELNTTGDKPPAPVEGDALLYSSGTGYLTAVVADGRLYKLDLGTNVWSRWTGPQGTVTIPNCGQICGLRAYCPTRSVAFIAHKNTGTGAVDVWAVKI